MQAAVITFEHLSLNLLGCYGDTLIRTPHFDSLAASSVVFDSCYAPSISGQTAAGLAQFVERLGECGGHACVADCRGSRPLGREIRQTIADWQSSACTGRPALLWIQCSAIESPWQAAIERVTEIARASLAADALADVLAAQHVDPADDAPPTAGLATALENLQAAGHLARDAIAPTREIGTLRRLVYAAAVTALDDWLGELLDLLEPVRRPESMLIVAAGNGDLTGPHAGLSAGCPPLIEPLIHVPLLIQTGTSADGTRRGALTSTADIAPTLAEWYGVDAPPAAFDARSLWPLLRDDSFTVREELLIGSAVTGWCLRTADFACLCPSEVVHAADGAWPDTTNGRPRLFVKPDDVWDTLDVAAQHPEATAEMVRRIRSRVDETVTGKHQVGPAADGP